MCDCKTEMEAALLKKVREMKPDAEGLEGSLSGYAFMFKENTMVMRPVTTFDIEYMHTFKNGNKKKKKEKVNVALPYCPHCGEKVS